MHSKPGFIIWSSAIVCVGLAIAALSNRLAQTSEATRGQSLGLLLVCALAAGTSVWRLIRLYRAANEMAVIPGAVRRPAAPVPWQGLDRGDRLASHRRHAFDHVDLHDAHHSRGRVAAGRRWRSAAGGLVLGGRGLPIVLP